MKSWFRYILLFSLLVDCYDAASSDCGEVDASFEVILHKKLLCKYDKDNRPVKNHNNAVNVTVRMLLKSMFYSSAWAHTEVLTIKTWTSLRWTDEFLTWDPKDYGDLKSIIIHSSRIWIPDFSVYNSPTSGPSSFSSPCMVEYTGRVTCIPQLSHSGYCSMNYKNWPYDSQTCMIVYGTWMNKGEEVNFNLATEPITLSSYRENKYWKLLAVNATKFKGVYKNVSETFPTLQFKFTIERHAISIVTILVTPALAMVSMTLISLCLNIASMERFILMFFNIACHFFYMNNVKNYVPSSGDELPDAMIYFRDSTILSCIVLFHCLIMRNMVIYTKTVPIWVNNVTELMNTSAGRIVFHEFDPSDSVKIVTEDPEGVSKVEDNVANREWKKLVLIINRIFSLVIIITYAILILIYLL